MCADEPFRFVEANKYWDKISKFLICFMDAGLNWYFLRIVKQRLVKYYGLKKYAPLVAFNAKLMVLSVGMDVSCLERCFPCYILRRIRR